jgi:hypothetical protein
VAKIVLRSAAIVFLGAIGSAFAAPIVSPSNLPNVYQALRKQKNLPADIKGDLAAGPREEIFLPLGDGTLYVASMGWAVVFVLVGKAGEIQDAHFEVAKQGFSISWRDGLVVTLHRHPGTGMFYDDPMHVSKKGEKLIFAPVADDSSANSGR